MGHYSRLAQRKSETPSEWLKTCSEIGHLVNSWSGRNDLAVYAGKDAVDGQAIAAFYVKTSEVEINLDKAFGSATTPAMVGDLTQRVNQFDHAEAIGVIYHEALHAKYSEWNGKALEAMNPMVHQTFQLLDESRIERKGVVAMPNNQLFLRASAIGLSLEDLTSEAIENLSDIRACARVSLLALARVDAGVVKLSDVDATYKQVVSVIGQDLFNKLRAIWVEFQSLATSEVARGEALAQKWNDLLKEADPEGEAGEMAMAMAGEGGEGEGEGGSGMSEALADLLDALAEDASNTSTSTASDLADQQTTEEWQEATKVRNSEAKRQSESKKTATKVFSNASGAGESGSRSTLINKRNPTGSERASAVKIGQMLEKAKYRERSVHERKSVEPKGRLNTRTLIQNKALEAKGVVTKNPAWTHKVRKHTDDPTLRMGIMVDISGSMSGAMEALATTAWVMSEAGRRVQAKTAMVYYGSGVFPTLKVGQKLEQVSVWSAPDGTEKFGEAFEAVDGTLGLTYGDGVRLLVIVSDGHYTSNETERTKEAVRLCKENGVGIIWITPKSCGRGMGKTLLGGYGVVLDGLDENQIAEEVGRGAVEALAKASVA